MLMNDEGGPKGIAFITDKTKDEVAAARNFVCVDYGGMTLEGNLANDSGKGKKGRGKDKAKGKASSESDASAKMNVEGRPKGTA
eukprot:CAMPEP_0168429666 /NCGR_PEP_ID=MMETSP0228-20121227/37488_1 /TAXON_ID=133427 /ORGANISM="Protoceratium reticulatum, Strain CCCM 535 (=CCMP 1889)" /LENGTH=83 /DNA_ID=CAMNT_0008443759 /DNA_START=42 /DNA_END=290 /DNA_ORIENTATION=+